MRVSVWIFLVQLFLIFPLLSGHNIFAQVKAGNTDSKLQIIDSWHYSHVFGEIRKYRIFLPAGYVDNPEKRYPVIYFFHGWSQRYFGPVGDDYSNYDQGDDNNGDNIANFVFSHEVIVVKIDGYNNYEHSEYNLNPYNLGEVESFRQFPIYFPEFVDFIDNHYRTVADREHRAVSGLSMGGFMTFMVSGKYPHLVSAAGNFCGSPEFFVGPLKFPVEYRNLDMYDNYGGVNVRFHYGDTDNLRFYHQDMNRVWTQVMDNYQFKIYPAAHTTCGLSDMFEFLLKTFENPPKKPDMWDHIDVYPDFSIWDYKISSDRFRPGFTILENVDKRGFKSSVRTFLPDGELMPFVDLSVTTPAIYEKDQRYVINHIDDKTTRCYQDTIKSDDEGRLRINIDGALNHIGINRMTDQPNLCLAAYEITNMNWATNRKNVNVSIKILNKGLADTEGIKVKLSATRKSATIIDDHTAIDRIAMNEIKECNKPFTFIASSDTIEISKFKLTITDKDDNEWSEFIEIPLRKDLPYIEHYEIADGKRFTVAKAGIDSVSLFLGNGNGDGVANPGESIVILVKDMGKYWRTNLYSLDPHINPFGENIRGSDNWVGYDHVNGSAKFTTPVISADCPENHEVEFFAEYWLPHNKDHRITQCKIKAKVTGKDTTPPKLQWVYVTGDNTVQARMYDGAKIEKVTARLLPKIDVKGLDYVHLEEPNEIPEIELNDEGRDGDRAKGDGVYGKIIHVPYTYFYEVEIEAMDVHGNSNIEKYDEVFLIY